jgi:hypothetical protein
MEAPLIVARRRGNRIDGTATGSSWSRTRKPEEAQMAVVIVNEIEGGSQEMYDEVNPKVMEGDSLPDGCQLHIAGPIENGWRVITVWESEDRFQQFRDEKLLPALRETGEGDRISPQISAQPVHNLLTS